MFITGDKKKTIKKIYIVGKKQNILYNVWAQWIENSTFVLWATKRVSVTKVTRNKIKVEVNGNYKSSVTSRGRISFKGEIFWLLTRIPLTQMNQMNSNHWIFQTIRLLLKRNVSAMIMLISQDYNIFICVWRDWWINDISDLFVPFGSIHGENEIWWD